MHAIVASVRPESGRNTTANPTPGTDLAGPAMPAVPLQGSGAGRGSAFRVMRRAGVCLVLCGLSAALTPLALLNAQSPVKGRQKQKRTAVPAATPTVAAPVNENLSSATASRGDVEIDDGHPLRPALKRAYASRAAIATVADYTATFNKQERVGNRMVKQKMTIKLREQPFSVYLNFQGQEAGREVLFPDPRNPQHLLVHPEGIKAIAGTVSLPLTGPEVAKENRYPISQIGMRQMLETIIRQWEAETKYGETKVDFYPDARLGGIPCTVIVSTHPQPRNQFRFHMTRLYFDKQTNLPIRVEQYAWPRNTGDSPPLLEEYTYTNVKANQGFSDRDFDPRNRAYHF